VTPSISDKASERSHTLSALRQHLAQIAPARIHVRRLEAGHPVLDPRIGGWPQPGISAVLGSPGVGRLGLVLSTLQRLTGEGRPVAIVDPSGWLHPPGLPDVDLAHVLLVRSGAGRAGWATEQLTRCGAFPLVLLLDPPRLGRAGRRLQRACEAGPTALIVLSERRDPDLPAGLRLAMSGPERVVLEKGGRAPVGTVVALTPPHVPELVHL